MLAMLKVVDSHVHFWDPRYLRYPWLSELPPLNRVCLPEHIPTQGPGWTIDALVFVQADCAPEQGLAEADWVSGLAIQDPRLRAMVAFAPLEQGERVRLLLEQLKSRPLVKGVRRLIQSEGPGFSLQPDFVAGVRLLADYGFSFDLCIKHPQLQEVAQLVRQCPAVNFVLDHFGKPDVKARQFDLWQKHLAELAALPNVTCKLSGLVTEADWQHWQPADLWPYLNHALDVFGVERVMFGSDWPVLTLAATYPQWLMTLLEATRSLSEAEHHKLFYENAWAFYRLGSSERRSASA